MLTRTMATMTIAVSFLAAPMPMDATARAQAPLKLAPSVKETPKQTKTARAAKAAKPSPAAEQNPSRRVAPSAANNDTVMRGADSVDLIARLPWWRADQSAAAQLAQEKKKEKNSQVLAAADAWLASSAGTAPAAADGVNDLTAAYALADPGELNEIDMAAGDHPEPAAQPWITAILTMLGGALAAASTARFLFV